MRIAESAERTSRVIQQIDQHLLDFHTIHIDSCRDCDSSICNARPFQPLADSSDRALNQLIHEMPLPVGLERGRLSMRDMSNRFRHRFR